MDNDRDRITTTDKYSATPDGIDDSERLVRQEEAAILLSVSPRCLENWRHRGEGPNFVKISKRCIRYRKLDLYNYVEQRIRTSTSDTGEDAA